MDGRLHVSNLEAIRSSQIGSDLADSKINFSDLSTARIGEDWDTTLNFPFGLENASTICQKALQQDHALRFRNHMHSSSESDSTQLEGRTTPPRYPFRLRNSSDM